MIKDKLLIRSLLLALTVLLITVNGYAQQAPQQPSGEKAAPTGRLQIEPKALDILKAACSRLAAAKSMRFTAVVSYENPSVPGPPLIYMTKSEVTVQRPDKLKVITPGDGPAAEFYYDGKKIMAFAPAENLVAIVEDAPPTIDIAVEEAFHYAAIYFSFTDMIVADPYKDIADGLTMAFYIGQSNVIDGITTDMVAYETHGVFIQIWIGAEDKLPRLARAIYRNDPAQLRHALVFSNWQLNGNFSADEFSSARAASAKRIPFARPDAQLLPGVKPPAEGEPSKSQ